MPVIAIQFTNLVEISIFLIYDGEYLSFLESFLKKRQGRVYDMYVWEGGCIPKNITLDRNCCGIFPKRSFLYFTF